MTTEQQWLGAGGALVVGVALVALLLAVLARRRALRAEAALTRLAHRVAELESPAAPEPVAEPGSYVITALDAGAEPAVVEARPLAQPIDGRLFADVVARETVVKAASWTHGLRRALSAESRNRIRFQVRQETRRSGRERRAEMKQALREYRARERAVREDVA
ncbi:hypothetical protein HN031_19810 [Nocardioides sp. zg-1308]|uniref:hypothetical protein n=1 Tax=Nocardioides sp. zg-1308 TaxID=2736253 RepID=UPI001554792E|nr:hypothetical protein [Nocardioides sp. zg-1308]NPD06927.1 hypothetical protein [Nocardioides sp. zg-1308]